MIPTSISDVARERVANPEQPLWKPLGEFLDSFYDAPSAAAFREEPTIAISAQDGAYLAAAAEHLCSLYGFEPPSWVSKPFYFLKVAHWPEVHGRATEAICLAESPTSFRRRFVFTEAKPLRRKAGPVSRYA